MTVDIDFFHYRCLIDEKKDLKQLTTPHIQKKEKQNLTFDEVSPKFNFVKKGKLQLSKRQIFLKNIALSESVYVDPLKDFQEYESYKDGRIEFPFYGKHLPLRILSQDTKNAALQIEGTIGEVIAGIFFEGYLNGRIIVRPIFKYPDFIGWLPNVGFGYCESKCHDANAKTIKRQLDKNILNGRVPKQHLKELIAKTSLELISKDDLTIFLSFSLIESFKPAKIKHTVLELYTNHRKVPYVTTPIAPDALIDDILEDALKETIQDLSEKCREDESFAKAYAQEGMFNIARDLNKKISEIEELANIKGKLPKIKELQEKIDDHINKDENKKLINAAIEGKDISNIKFKTQIGSNFSDKKIKQMEMKKLKEYDDNYDIYMQFLDSQSINDLDNLASKYGITEIPCLKDSQHEFYICGNALIGLVDKNISKPSIINLNDQRWKDMVLK